MNFPEPKLDTDPTLTLRVFVEVNESKSDAFTIALHKEHKETYNLPVDDKGRFIVNFAKYDPTAQGVRDTTNDVGEAVMVAHRIAAEVRGIIFKGIVIYVEGDDGHSIVIDVDGRTATQMYNGEVVKELETGE